MNRKKWLILAATACTLLIAAVLIATGVDWSNPVGILYRDGENSVNAQFHSALEESLRAQGFEVIVTYADGSSEKQLSQIQELAQKHCGALIVEPVTEDAQEPLLEALQNTGLPAVLTGQRPEKLNIEDYPQIRYVDSGSEQVGTEQGNMVSQLPDGGDINGDGTVCYMVIQGPEEDPDATARTEAFEAVLQSGTIPAERVCIDCGDWTEESGKTICSRELAVYGMDIEVIVCGNDAMARGAAQAISEGGWQVGQDVYLFGVDGDTQALSLIEDGQMTGTVYQDVETQAQAVCTVLVNLMNGQDIQSRTVSGICMVTQDNVAQLTMDESEYE